MSFSIHAASVGTFVHVLGALDKILSKAEAHAAAKKFDPAVLLSARLAPDMFDLTRQVQIACDMAKSGAARLAGQEPPSHPDDEKTFAELHARVAKVLDYLGTLDKAAIDASAERDVKVPMRDRTLEFKGAGYLTTWVLPNFYFHVTTVYAILRHNGVELGKMDFLGA